MPRSIRTTHTSCTTMLRKLLTFVNSFRICTRQSRAQSKQPTHGKQLGLCGLVRLLQACNVNLVHLEHRLHHSLGFCRVRIAHQLHQRHRDDLPRQPIFISEPPATILTAPIRKLFPEFVDLRLSFATHKQRNGRRKVELRPTIERREFLSFKGELHDHHAPLRPWTSLAITLDGVDPRVLENGDIKVCGFFSLIVEPQERGDLLHRIFSFWGHYSSSRLACPTDLWRACLSGTAKTPWYAI